MPRQRRSSFKKSSRKRKRINVFVFAEILRKRMTKSESLLWKKLKKAMIRWGVIFEPQGVVAGRFIADFVCRSSRLIIEVDGSIHAVARVRRKDNYRTAVLTRLGYTIIRFNNTTVNSNVDLVLSKIERVIVE